MRFPRLLGALLAGCGFNPAGVACLTGCGEDAVSGADAQEQADAALDAGQSEADAALVDGGSEVDAAMVDAGVGECDLLAGCEDGLACHLGENGLTYCLPAGPGSAGTSCATDGDCGWGSECQGTGFNRRCRSIGIVGNSCGSESSVWLVGYEEIGDAFYADMYGVCFQSCHLTGPFAGVCGYPTETCTPVMPPHIFMGEEWGVCR